MIARYRTVHVDLTAWPECSTDRAGRACRCVLKSPDGDSIAHIALPSDTGRRRYAAVLPDKPDEPGWLPEGRYTVQVLAWVARQATPRTWTPAVQDGDGNEIALQIEIADEPRRPHLADLREAA